ncbi:hypothetical protein RNJ44_04872 [Nakaseomyces bracarensis]|uniref:Vid28p n=1 Tax=Nakaseomyces bracarensis TaxID=273131 RepID=A0ABR4NWA7_9SACH
MIGTSVSGLDELMFLRDKYVGDLNAKVESYFGEGLKIFNELLTVRCSDATDLQLVKLDILTVLTNLDTTVIEALGQVYYDIIQRVYNEVELASTLSINSALINYKFVKLVNACRFKAPTIKYPHYEQFQQYLLVLLNKLFSTTIDSNNIATTIELLTFHLQDGKDNVTIISPLFRQQLAILLTRIFRKYGDQINYKYMIRVRKHKNGKSVKYKPLSNRGISSTLSIPNAVVISDTQDEKLLSLALVLYTWSYKGTKVHSLWEDGDFQLFVTSFMKSEILSLKCAALEFLISPYMQIENTWQKKQAILKILPYLLDLFNQQPIPPWFDLFETLIQLIELYNKHEPMSNPIIGFLSKSNMLYGILGLFFECMSLNKQTDASIKTLTKCVKFCATFAANDEKYRSLLLEHKFLLTNLEFGLELHLSLLNEFLSCQEQFKNGNFVTQMNGLPALYDSDLCYEWLYLLKSFSRSVTALRTTLKRNKLPELLLQLLRKTHEITKNCYFVGQDFLDAELRIMGQTLGTICNFVVEFSNLQPYLVKNGIVDIIENLLTDPLFNSSSIWECEARKKALLECNTDEVKTNALWVLRHLMYNCQNEEKLDMLSKIPMEVILEFVNDPSWSVQAQAFQLIRNLTSNSRKVVNILLENFKEVEYRLDPVTGKTTAVGSTYLFDFLVHKMKKLDTNDLPQKKTLEGILYIIVNLAAVNENKKDLVIEQDEILEVLSEILAASPQNPTSFGNDSELKLASLWVLNNLLWNSEFSNHSQFALDGYPGISRDSSVAPGDISETPSGRVSRNENITGSSGGNDTNHDEEMDYDDRSAIDDDDEEDYDRSDEFVRPAHEYNRNQNNNATVLRCKKLVRLGIHELVKKNIFDDSLSVREKARTLSFHMDLLLREKK